MDSSSSVGCLLLTDLANAFARSREFDSRSVDRTTRLGMAYLRGILHILCLSYVSALFNLADLGAKFPTDRRPVGRVNLGNSMSIGFLSRKELKAILYFLQK